MPFFFYLMSESKCKTPGRGTFYVRLWNLLAIVNNSHWVPSNVPPGAFKGISMIENIYLLSLKSLVSSTALWHLLMVNLTIWAEIVVSLQPWETVYENLCGLQDRNYSIIIFFLPQTCCNRTRRRVARRYSCAGTRGSPSGSPSCRGSARSDKD